MSSNVIRALPIAARRCRAAFLVAVAIGTVLLPAPARAQAAADDALPRWTAPDGRRAPPLPRLGPDLESLVMLHERVGADLSRLRTDSAARRPGVRIDAGGRVLVHAVADASGAARLRALGATRVAAAGRLVSGWIPIANLRAAAYSPEFRALRPAYASTHAGRVTSQGDAAIAGPLARAGGAEGAGVLVGVLSDSFDCRGGASAGLASGDLPQYVVLKNAPATGCAGLTDEGRAMLEIVRDVAPGATGAFHTAFDGAPDFAAGIRALAARGARVIVDDVIYFDEPMFQDGAIAQAADEVVAQGVAYFAAAGNQSRNSYESAFRSSGRRGVFATSVAHDFDPSGATSTRQSVTIPSGATVTIVLQWDQPFASVSAGQGAQNDLDLFLAQGTTIVAGSYAANVDGDPLEIVQFKNTGASTAFDLLIDRAAGASPGLMKFVWFGPMSVTAFQSPGPTVYGHAAAAGARAVAAADYRRTPAYGTAPAVVESFSSVGGVPTLFDRSGARIAVLRAKPELTAPDGVDTTFFGTDVDGTSFPNFFGSSAAAPHAAAVAALLRGANPQLSPAAVYVALQDSALEMDAAGFDFVTGAGLVQAPAALAAASGGAAGIGFGTLPDGTLVSGSIDGAAFATLGPRFTASDRGDGRVTIGGGPASTSASGFAGSVVLVTGTSAQLRLDFTNAVGAVGFAFATASGQIAVDVLGPAGTPLASGLRFTGTESLSFGGVARVGGSAELGGIGPITAVLIRSVAPDADLRVDAVRIGAIGATAATIEGDAPLPPWTYPLLAAVLAFIARRRSSPRRI